MKNSVLAIMVTLLLAACSSGTTVADLPQNVTSFFRGTFQNTPGTQDGTVSIDLIDDGSGTVTGNIIFESSGPNCLRNNIIAGTSTGFNITLTADQAADIFTTVITVTEETVVETTIIATGAVSTSTSVLTLSTLSSTSSTGTVGETESRDIKSDETIDNGTTIVRTITTQVTNEAVTAEGLTGVLTIQLVASNQGSVLNGTYTTSGDSCENATGSGTMNLSR